MPSWNIHLEAGNRLADQVKLTPKKRREFLIGCLLPDINNGYVNKPKTVYPHEATHFARANKSSLNFYADYKDKIKSRDPLYMGYLFHLFTDGYFNYNFYHNFNKLSSTSSLTKDEKRDVKHHDFWLYDTNFHHALDFASADLPAIIKKANTIKTVAITEQDLTEVGQILKDDHLNDDIRGGKYLFYDQKSLDELLDNTIKEFIRQYLVQDNPGPRPIKELHDDPTMASVATKGNRHA